MFIFLITQDNIYHKNVLIELSYKIKILLDAENYIKLMRLLPKDWPKDIYGIPFVKKSIIDISNMDEEKLLEWMNTQILKRNMQNI